MLDIAMSNNGTLGAEDKDMILVRKKQMVRNSGVLDLVDTPERIEDIRGLDTLKSYLRKKAKVMENLTDTMKFGVNVPKGVFIVGMPGCGKSLCAKATAALFDVPLLKMDMGSLMGKYQGESEENLRKAIRIAEAAAPCVLWIDEIEKGFFRLNSNVRVALMRSSA
ncbi:MAG: AAA family ATPase [Muribaculaceae bacterium]|nr:AAA family ATPase [Muribaculaceae bacterium]